MAITDRNQTCFLLYNGHLIGFPSSVPLPQRSWNGAAKREKGSLHSPVVLVIVTLLRTSQKRGRV